VNPDFWHGKRVFLTGHTGFKGAWLALWLQSVGAQVRGYALAPPTQPNLFTLARVAEGMDSVLGDIRDFETLRSRMAEFQPEVLIHLAAQPLVRYSYANPLETYATNVMGTVHVMEAMRQVGGLRAAVMITSDKCYENREWIWGYRENEPMGGHDPYSNSKGCAELAIGAYRSSYFNPANHGSHGVALASARAGNVIGGGDWAADRLIPDIIAAFRAGRPVVIRNPGAVRPWQHVLEPLDAYLVLAEHLWRHGPEFAEAWNFGPNDEDAKPVQWIVEQLVQRWGEGASWMLDDAEHPHEAHSLKLDCSKARTRLNWVPRWQLSTALDHIVDWYKALETGEDMRALSLGQIEKYSG
jgi:CDP-glucose 4,6-dehydratase